MAEIKIEKRNNNWLPWLLGIIGIVLLAWLAVDFFDSDGEPELLTADEVDFPDAHLTDRTDNDVINARVQQTGNSTTFDKNWDGSEADYDSNVIYFLSSINQIDAEMNLEHDYSNTALRALANSLMALSKEQGMANELDVKSKCMMIKEKADQLDHNHKSTKHADMIKSAALTAVEILEEIQSEKFPEMSDEVANVAEAANKISTRTLTLDQKSEIKTFFNRTAEVLQEMRKEQISRS